MTTSSTISFFKSVKTLIDHTHPHSQRRFQSLADRPQRSKDSSKIQSFCGYFSVLRLFCRSRKSPINCSMASGFPSGNEVVNIFSRVSSFWSASESQENGIPALRSVRPILHIAVVHRSDKTCRGMQLNLVISRHIDTSSIVQSCMQHRYRIVFCHIDFIQYAKSTVFRTLIDASLFAV